MPAFVTPTLFDSSRSFRRLRSFHLSPLDIGAASKHDTLPETSPKKLLMPAPRNVTNPLRGSSITTLVVIVSLIFIFTISFSFVGADVDEEYFGLFLKRVAETSPGIVLLGENVDVDVDEPSVTVRWSILACGEDFVLPGSGVYGSNVCGLPAQPFYIFVDSDQTPTATYDPSQIPFSRDSGYRRNIPNLFQFDSDHVLDVHEARLYPFDTYMLSSTIRAFSFDNVSLPIRGAATIGTTSSFNIETVDVDSYSTSNNTQSSSRDVDMRISRPGAIRVIILLLFGISWILAHLSIVLAIVARKITEVKPMIKYLVFAGAIFLILPQLRNSMPDAPGLDGVLIDSIGFFPQVVITAISTLTILLCLIGRELDDIKRSQENILPILSPPPSPPPSATSRPRPPPIPTPISSPMEKSHYDKYRLVQHLQGHYVFPPIQTTHRILPSVDYQSSTHRKSKTMSRIRETSEESFFVE